MARIYLCPICRENRKSFEIIYKMSQEVLKDEATGAVVFQSDELTTLVRQDGRPDLDIRCGRCGYTGSEVSFARAAERDGGPAPRRVPVTSRRA